MQKVIVKIVLIKMRAKKESRGSTHYSTTACVLIVYDKNDDDTTRNSHIAMTRENILCTSTNLLHFYIITRYYWSHH